jgi:ubiquinone/menaquinone biosynthesis C-methylase UbiE
MEKSIDDVAKFWNENPLWKGEFRGDIGNREFFESHKKTIIQDCLAGTFDLRTMPHSASKKKVLDVGCGIGFWCIELCLHGCENVTGVDISSTSLELAKKRASLMGYNVNFKLENAENLSFEDASFTHVNCQGVIHHTPETEKCVTEIARVLKVGGTASISVYHKNIFLKNWWFFRFFGILLSKLGAGLSGRGREKIFEVKDVNEIVRYYDGASNPIGKCYSREEFEVMLKKHFEIEEMYLHFFPARALPFKVPGFVHRLLDKYFGFMVYANVIKK